jgi:flagellar hook protein FlgE
VWNVEIYADAAEVEAGDHPDGLLGSGTVTFNGEGTLASTSITPTIPRRRSARRSGSTGSMPTARTTARSPRSRHGRQGRRPQPVRQRLQRRLRAAERCRGRRAEWRQEGYVIATFTNGATQWIYKLPLATFANPLALDPRTGNVFAQTAASGEFNLRDAGAGGAGSVVPSALEAANVDLADEFTKMIVTQRAYSANARIITTADEMLDELIRISRQS